MPLTVSSFLFLLCLYPPGLTGKLARRRVTELKQWAILGSLLLLYSNTNEANSRAETSLFSSNAADGPDVISGSCMKSDRL